VQRKAGLQFLSNANLKVLTDVALPKYLDDSIRSLEGSKDGLAVDLEDKFHELTTILFGFLAFNVSLILLSNRTHDGANDPNATG